MFGKGNDRAFGPTGLEPMTKKASRKAWEVCGYLHGSLGDTMAYVWKRERTQVREN